MFPGDSPGGARVFAPSTIAPGTRGGPLHRERADGVARRRSRPAPAVGLPPRRPRAAGDARRMRARRVRRLHRPARRRGRTLLPPAGPPGRRRTHPDRGRARGRGRRPHAPSAPGGLPAPLRPPVRLLHRRHPDGRRRAPRRAPPPVRCAAGPGGDPPPPLGPPLPLHGLRADRGRHRRRLHRRRRGLTCLPRRTGRCARIPGHERDVRRLPRRAGHRDRHRHHHPRRPREDEPGQHRRPRPAGRRVRRPRRRRRGTGDRRRRRRRQGVHRRRRHPRAS